jgi:hypothetical protein
LGPVSVDPFSRDIGNGAWQAPHWLPQQSQMSILDHREIQQKAIST